MDKRQSCSQRENEQKTEHDDIHTEETRRSLKSDNNSCCDLENLDNNSIAFENKSQDISEEPKSSQHNEVQRADTNQDRHSLTDLQNDTEDYETIKELQKKAQPNENYFVTLQSLVDNQKLSSESSQLKRQSVTLEYMESGTKNEEKHILNRFIGSPKDLIHRQQLQVYCNPIVHMEESPFQDKDIRNKFIRKVQIIHLFVLLFTIAGIAIFNFVPELHSKCTHKSTNYSSIFHDEYFDNDDDGIVHLIVFWSTLAAFIILSVVFGCVPSVAKLDPANIIVLVVFVLLQICFLGIFDAHFCRYATMTAVVIAAVVLIIIMCMSMQKKWDLASCTFLLFIGVMALLLAGAYYLLLFLIKKPKAMYVIYGGIVTAAYCMIHMIQLQIIMAYQKYEIGREDYLPAAVYFYFMDFRRCLGVN